MEYGVENEIDVYATDLSGVDIYWVNNPIFEIVNYSIDLSEIPVGEYDLQINVNDTLNNIQTADISVSIKPSLASQYSLYWNLRPSSNSIS